MAKGDGETIHARGDASYVVKYCLHSTAAVGRLFAPQRLQNLLYIALLNARPEGATPLEVGAREKKKLPRAQPSAADRHDKSIGIVTARLFYARKRSYPVQVRTRRELPAENLVPYRCAHLLYHSQPQTDPRRRTAQMHGDLRYAHAVTAMQSVHYRTVLKFRQPLVARVAQQGKQAFLLISLHREDRNHADA